MQGVDLRLGKKQGVSSWQEGAVERDCCLLGMHIGVMVCQITKVLQKKPVSCMMMAGSFSSDMCCLWVISKQMDLTHC